MESIRACREQCVLLEKQISEAQARWQIFLSTQSSYKPLMKLAGERLPPPVVSRLTAAGGATIMCTRAFMFHPKS